MRGGEGEEDGGRRRKTEEEESSLKKPAPAPKKKKKRTHSCSQSSTSHLVQTTPTSCLAAKCILNPLGYSALYPHPSSWHPWFLTVDRGRTGRGAGRRGVGVEQMGQALLEWERQREWSWDLQETQLYRS